MAEPTLTDVVARVDATELLRPGRPVVVLLSGGRDSVCLLDLAVTIAGADAVGALHVNYGLRDAAAADEDHCAALCERLGVPLVMHRPGRPAAGNLQAWARDQRYAVAARLALERGADVAAGHTATDQVETVLYRLAASPGRRALLGMHAREGRLVRPLLAVTRAETAAYCEAGGLAWREDASNADPAFARNRVRHNLVPALRELHPAAEANVLRTLETLRDEAAVLDDVITRTLAGRTAIEATELATLPAALRRLVFARLAGNAPVGHRVDEVIALATKGGTHRLDLTQGLRATTTYGHIAVERREEQFPPAELGLGPPTEGTVLPPSGLTWRHGTLTLERGSDLAIGEGVLDAAAVGELRVRTWRAGDRMRPLGLGGSRSLQDLFTDRKVPRAQRESLPVVTTDDGEIAWVPGIATGERFRVTDETRDRLRLAWRAG